MTEVDVSPQLRSLADDFAADLTTRLDRIFGLGVRFQSWVTGTNVTVGVFEGGQISTIPLNISGKPRLLLFVKYHCCWNTGGQFLAIEKSWIHVKMNDKRDMPLFRYEYIRQPQGGVPSAHFQIHAHSDEMMFLLSHADKGRPRERKRQDDRIPRLAEFHFPVGGPRYRPCLEDIAEVIIEEFGLDTADSNWRSTIQDGREQWRRIQLRTAVTDAPEDAAEALEGLGYTVIRPEKGPPCGAVAKLRAY